MTKKTGSYVYILSKDNLVKDKIHKKTLNEAKFVGLNYFYESKEPFFRFTKIPFPHLFYSSNSYIVYVEYARLEKEDIPYTVELSDYDESIKKDMKLFTEVFSKEFVYNKEARAKYRDKPKRDYWQNKRRKEVTKNRRSNYKAYH